MITGKNVRAAFSVSGSGGISGKFVGAGNKFSIQSSGVSLWFDGKTMYTYNPRIGEVTVTNPTLSELMETNPLLYVSRWKSMFTVKKAPRQPSGGDICLILSPKGKSSGISRAVLTVNRRYIPVKIAVKTDKGSRFSIKITSFSNTSAVSASEFIFPKKRFSGVKINDLR